jgi:hypothetical protein
VQDLHGVAWVFRLFRKRLRDHFVREKPFFKVEQLPHTILVATESHQYIIFYAVNHANGKQLGLVDVGEVLNDCSSSHVNKDDNSFAGATA